MTSVGLQQTQPDEEALLRLETAAGLAFPDGSMSAHGLRKEHRRGRLDIWRVAGKDYTTLDAIARMRKQCLLPVKAPACGSAPRAATQPGKSRTQPSISSVKEGAADDPSALDALQRTLRGLKKPCESTSERPTLRKRSRKAPVLQLISQ
jgi:hypothetical protein